MKQIKSAGEFVKPTVGEFARMANLAAKKKGVEITKLHELIAIGDRNFRKWVSKADVEPDNQSIVPFWACNLVHAMAYGRPLLKPLKNVEWTMQVDSKLIMAAIDYECPTTNKLKEFVGEKSITELTRQQLARRIGTNGNWLSVQIRNQSFSFGSWATILLLCGVPEYLLFPVEPDVSQLKDASIGESIAANASFKVMLKQDSES